MGRAERARWANNDVARELLDASRSRALNAEELDTLRKTYTGYGGLGWNTTQHFTPQVVCRFVVDLLDIQPGQSVFEPSCGGGAFLQELPEGCDVLGIELMQDAATVAKLCNPNARIEQGDALDYLDEVEDQFDICIGNPPFDKFPKHHAPKGYNLGPQCDRLEWYFVELAYRSLKPGGLLALLVPDGILSNSKDMKLRQWFIQNAWYRATISLPAETFKTSGTGCKTSIMIIQKPLPGITLAEEQRCVLMAVCEHIGWDSRLRETGQCDLPAILEYQRQSHPLDLCALALAEEAPVPVVPPSCLQPHPEYPANKFGQLCMF